MSALARYFKFVGKEVAGYDRTPTPITEGLMEKGISVHFEDNVDLISDTFKQASLKNQIILNMRYLHYDNYNKIIFIT